MLEERGANITEAHALIHNGRLIQYSFPGACIRVTSCYALMWAIQELSLNQTLQLEDVIVAIGSLTLSWAAPPKASGGEIGTPISSRASLP